MKAKVTFPVIFLFLVTLVMIALILRHSIFRPSVEEIVSIETIPEDTLLAKTIPSQISQVIVDSTVADTLAPSEEQIAPKTEVTVSREDTLVIMARQESDEERKQRLSQISQQLQQPAEDSILAKKADTTAQPAVAAQPVVIQKEVVLGQGKDTLWTDERPRSLPWRISKSTYTHTQADTMVMYRYSYSDRPVKRVEYVVTSTGGIQILSEELIQAMQSQLESIMAAVVARDSFQVDFVINVAFNQSSGQFTVLESDEKIIWDNPDHVKFMEYYLRDSKPDLVFPKFMSEVNLDLNKLAGSFPFVQIIIHVIGVGQNVPTLLSINKSIWNWLIPDGILMFSSVSSDEDEEWKLNKMCWTHWAEAGVFWNSGLEDKMAEWWYGKFLTTRLSVGNLGMVFGLDALSFDFKITKRLHLELPMIGGGVELGSGNFILYVYGVYGGGSRSDYAVFVLPRIIYLW